MTSPRLTRRRLMAASATALGCRPLTSAVSAASDSGSVSAISTQGTATNDDAHIYVGADDSTLYAIEAATGTQAWAFSEISGSVLSSPTVVDGTVYVGSDGTLDENLNDAALYAVDAASGTLDWEFTDPQASLLSSPTVVDGTVYVGSSEGTLYAVDAVSGQQEWTVTEPQLRVETSPAVADVPGGAGGSSDSSDGGTVYVGDREGTLFAVAASSGEISWTAEEPVGGLFASPTVVDVPSGAGGSSDSSDGGTVYVASMGTGSENNRDATLYAFDASSGDKQWAFTEPNGWLQSSPTVFDGTIYVGSADGTLYAVDAESGEQVWAFDDAAGSISSSPTVVDVPSGAGGSSDSSDGGTVYVGSMGTEGENNRDAALYAVEAATGQQEWAFTEPVGSVWSSPTVFAGTVYVGSDDGTLYAVDAESGEQVWAFTQPEAWVTSSPTVVTEPDGGNSVGSRVALQTLGHHHELAAEPTAPPSETSSTSTHETDTDASETASTGTSSETARSTEQAPDTGDEDGPGFGVGTVLTALGGAGYLLGRRLGTDDTDQ